MIIYFLTIFYIIWPLTADHTMSIANMLIDKIFSWMEQQKDCSEKLRTLATELETYRENVNTSQVVGSSASVVGAAAMTAAGILSFVTAGAAVPFLAVAGSACTGIGFATNMGSTIVETLLSSSTMKDAEKIAKKSNDLEKEIPRLIELLVKEKKKKEQNAHSTDVSSEDVVDCILKAMAEHSGVKWTDNLKFLNTLSDLSRNMVSGKDVTSSLLQKTTLALPFLTKFVITLVSKATLKASKKTGKAVISKGLVSLGPKAAAKALGRVGGGAIGLVVSVPELIDNCKEMDRNNFKTEASQCLRETATSLQTTYEEMKRELEGLRKVFEKLAKVHRCIENPEEKERWDLIEFAKENCKDEATLKWLTENSQSKAFIKLVRMFHFLKERIDEEEKGDHSKDIDIVFVAHGEIQDSMIPASCLMPVATIKDVVLYSPWNCTLSVDAAYGVATGCMQPHHRTFCCGRNDCSKPSALHQPTDLPNQWNSMKKAGTHLIPNIMLSPLGPKDGAWKRFEFLKNEHGLPERNRIVVPYIPGEDASERVPFYVVTLALSLVLLSSRFQATIHLTACLGNSSKRNKLDVAHLKRQYAYTIDHTRMDHSPSMPLELRPSLYRAFKAMFG